MFDILETLYARTYKERNYDSRREKYLDDRIRYTWL